MAGLEGNTLDPDLAGHFTVTRRRGVRLAGAPIASAVPEVPWADYLDSILRDYTWACERADDNPVYLVLNTCRIWAAVVEPSSFSPRPREPLGHFHVFPQTWHPLSQLPQRCIAANRRDGWSDRFPPAKRSGLPAGLHPIWRKASCIPHRLVRVRVVHGGQVGLPKRGARHRISGDGPYKGGTKGGAGSNCEVSSPQTSQLRQALNHTTR